MKWNNTLKLVRYLLSKTNYNGGQSKFPWLYLKANYNVIQCKYVNHNCPHASVTHNVKNINIYISTVALSIVYPWAWRLNFYSRPGTGCYLSFRCRPINPATGSILCEAAFGWHSLASIMYLKSCVLYDGSIDVRDGRDVLEDCDCIDGHANFAPARLFVVHRLPNITRSFFPPPRSNVRMLQQRLLCGGTRKTEERAATKAAGHIVKPSVMETELLWWNDASPFSICIW